MSWDLWMTLHLDSVKGGEIFPVPDVLFYSGDDKGGRFFEKPVLRWKDGSRVRSWLDI